MELIAQEDMYNRTRFPVGSTLVTVEQNSTQFQYQILPDTAALMAAAMSLKPHLSEMLYQANQARLDGGKTEYTPEQIAAWRQLKDTGIERLWFPSLDEIAERFLQALIDQAHAATQLPWVQEAQERYKQAIFLAMQNHE